MAVQDTFGKACMKKAVFLTGAGGFLGWIICRMPLMFGGPGPVAVSFIQPMLKAMREGRELKLFVDEFRKPLSGRDAAKGLLMALEKVTGTIHG
jgi:dTDP-4-dehydrorhamnose reductase